MFIIPILFVKIIISEYASEPQPDIRNKKFTQLLLCFFIYLAVCLCVCVSVYLIVCSKNKTRLQSN